MYNFFFGTVLPLAWQTQNKKWNGGITEGVVFAVKTSTIAEEKLSGVTQVEVSQARWCFKVLFILCLFEFLGFLPHSLTPADKNQPTKLTSYGWLSIMLNPYGFPLFSIQWHNWGKLKLSSQWTSCVKGHIIWTRLQNSVSLPLICLRWDCHGHSKELIEWDKWFIWNIRDGKSPSSL